MELRWLMTSVQGARLWRRLFILITDRLPQFFSTSKPLLERGNCRATDHSQRHPYSISWSLCLCAGTLPWCQYFLEDLLIERGEDQLVEVDEPTEANSELLQLSADRSQTSWERRRGLVLTRLQGSQEVALNSRVCEERGAFVTTKQINRDERDIEAYSRGHCSYPSAYGLCCLAG